MARRRRRGADVVARTPRSWPIRTASTPVAVTFVSAAVLGAIALAAAVGTSAFTAHSLFLVVLLVAIAIGYEEAMTRASRMRLRLADAAHQDMQGVWGVAAALSLPHGPAAVVAAAVASYLYVRQRRPAGRPLYREAFNGANVVLSCLACAAIFHQMSGSLGAGPWAVRQAAAAIIAILGYSAVNRLIVIAALAASRVRWQVVLGTRHENVVDLATLSLGGFVALAAVHSPVLAVLVLAPMVVLQRGAIAHELELAASTDAKTGLLNAVAWEQIVVRDLAVAAREHTDTAVLIIDVDHFKRVNDQFGHLAGDHVLKVIGETLRDTLREYDTIARFGGEEFVAVLPDTDASAALAAAERLRARVNELWVSQAVEGVAPEHDELLAVSVGVSTCADGAAEMHQLLHAADSALYRAKAAGRNRVVLADAPEAGSGAPALID